MKIVGGMGRGDEGGRGTDLWGCVMGMEFNVLSGAVVDKGFIIFGLVKLDVAE